MRVLFGLEPNPLYEELPTLTLTLGGLVFVSSWSTDILLLYAEVVLFA